LAFTQTLVLYVVNLAVPNFLGAVYDAHFTLVLVDDKKLNNFGLHIEIIVHVGLLRTRHSNEGNAIEFRDELVVEDGLRGKARDGPLAQGAYDGVLLALNLHRLTEESLRAEFILDRSLSLGVLALEVKREERP